MKLYLIRYGIYYECTQVSEWVYATRMGHVHTWSDLPGSLQTFTDQWEALRFMYQYHLKASQTKRLYYRGIIHPWYRLPYTLDYIKRHLIAKWPEDFL